jgi:hypothetical protein
MNDSNAKPKSRLGRNLSALLNHSEESLIKAMGLEDRNGDGHQPDAGDEELPMEAIAHRKIGKDQPDSDVDIPAVEKLAFKPAQADNTRVEPDLPIPEEWSVAAAGDQKNVEYRIIFNHQDLAPEELALPLGVKQSFDLSVRLHLPQLQTDHNIPPIVSKLHVYLLIFDPRSGLRIRMERSSQLIEPGKRQYSFPFHLEGFAAGSWNLSVQMYAALFGFSERRVVNLKVG